MHQCCALSVLCTSARISGPREDFSKPQTRKLLQAESRPQPSQCSRFLQPNILKTLIPLGRLLLAQLWTSAPLQEFRQPKWRVQLLLKHFVTIIPDQWKVPITCLLTDSLQLLAVIHLQYYIFIQQLPLSQQCPFCLVFIHSVPFSLSVYVTDLNRSGYRKLIFCFKIRDNISTL